MEELLKHYIEYLPADVLARMNPMEWTASVRGDAAQLRRGSHLLQLQEAWNIMEHTDPVEAKRLWLGLHAVAKLKSTYVRGRECVDNAVLRQPLLHARCVCKSHRHCQA